MKVLAYTAIIAASFVGAAAYADQGNDYANDFPPPGISSTHDLTRAQVLSDLADAKAQGGIVYGQEGFVEGAPQATAPESRAQVVQELKRAELAHRAGGAGEYPGNL